MKACVIQFAAKMKWNGFSARKTEFRKGTRMRFFFCGVTPCPVSGKWVGALAPDRKAT